MTTQRQWFSQISGAALVLVIGSLALTQRLPVRQLVAGDPVSRPCAIEPAGFLRGQLFGALNATLDWTGNELHCSGMTRPDGRSVRLYFAHETGDKGRLSIQISIAGQPAELAGSEAPANITVIDPSGHFYSSSGFDRCWARIGGVLRQSRSADLRIDGIIYCVATLPSLHDQSSLTLGDLHFAGRVDADAG